MIDICLRMLQNNTTCLQGLHLSFVQFEVGIEDQFAARRVTTREAKNERFGRAAMSSACTGRCSCQISTVTLPVLTDVSVPSISPSR
jgi:hypothetical protein